MRAMDLTGQRFGMLVVARRAPDRGGKPAWSCSCDCGAECHVASSANLRAGRVKSCGCLSRQMRQEDIAGKRFGRLTVIRSGRVARGRFAWWCECVCGKQVIAEADALKSGRQQSCGCYRLERMQARWAVMRSIVGDITGRRFGSLFVLSRIASSLWECACDCGNLTVVRGSSLKTGRTKTCWNCPRLNPTEITRRRNAASLRYTSTLGDGYVRRRIRTNTGLPTSRIPQQAVAAKREHLRVLRLLKEMKR